MVFLLGEPLCEGLYATVILWATLALVASSAFEASFASATDRPEKTVSRARTHPQPMMGKCFHPPSTKRVIPPPPIGDEKISPMLRTQMPDTKSDPPPAPGEEPSVSLARSAAVMPSGATKREFQR